MILDPAGKNPPKIFPDPSRIEKLTQMQPVQIYKFFVVCNAVRDPWAPKGLKGAFGSLPLVNPNVSSAMPLHCITSLCNAVVVG